MRRDPENSGRLDRARGWKSCLAASFAVSLAALLTLLAPGAALAHSGRVDGLHDLWTTWQFTPDIVVGTLLAAGLYIAGMWRRSTQGGWLRGLRHAAYLAGVAVIFVALQSPVDTLGDHNFTDHEIQHLLLRMLGPMLMMLAAPQATLVAGTPDWAMRRLVAPLVASRGLRGVFGLFAHPAVVLLVFVATLYVWQIPALHRAALLDDRIHYLMHATMLAAGLLFFWRVFDSRAAPKGLRFGARALMAVLVMPTQILLGAYLALKDSLVYPVYDVLGRVGAASPLADEAIGGIIVWIPSSMMMVVTILVIVGKWGSAEAVTERRGVRADEPLTALALRQGVAAQNRAMAVGFALIVVVFFTAAITIGVVSEMMSA